MATGPSLSIEQIPVSELVPYENNAKLHPDDQVRQIAASIAEFGDCDPIAVWHDAAGRPVIVEGHGRLLALKELGAETAPCVTLDHLSDEQRRAYAHVHNQTTLSSGFDDEIIAAEMEALPEFDWAAFGFDVPEAEGPDEVPDSPVPTDPETRCGPGDLWKLGDHRLLCGDSTDPASVARVLGALGASSADLLLTDPPYNVGLGYHVSPEEAMILHRRTDEKVVPNDEFESREDYVSFLVSALRPCADLMAPGASYYVWHASTENPRVTEALEAVGLPLRQVLVWVKGVFSFGRQDYQWRHELCAYGWKGGASHRFFGGHNLSTVFEDDPPDIDAMSKEELADALRAVMGEPSTVLRFAKPTRSGEHPTIKPVPLFARLIADSTRSGEVVLDPFGGSGTTAIACEHLYRRAAIIELDPGYCDTILARWEELTGSEAERCDRG